MDQTQSIYADLLINKVLTQGLLGNLTSESDVCEKSSFGQTPSSSYSNFSYIHIFVMSTHMAILIRMKLPLKTATPGLTLT